MIGHVILSGGAPVRNVRMCTVSKLWVIFGRSEDFTALASDVGWFNGAFATSDIMKCDTIGFNTTCTKVIQSVQDLAFWLNKQRWVDPYKETPFKPQYSPYNPTMLVIVVSLSHTRGSVIPWKSCMTQCWSNLIKVWSIWLKVNYCVIKLKLVGVTVLWFIQIVQLLVRWKEHSMGYTIKPIYVDQPAICTPIKFHYGTYFNIFRGQSHKHVIISGISEWSRLGWS